MKKTLLLYFIALATFTLKAQQSQINFDDGYLERIEIDSANPNNQWQIGKPHKLKFDSAFSFPNGIITDTLNYYSINNTSSFYIYFTWHSPFNWPELGFKFKINSDSLADFGNIEASYDNGDTWIDVIKDAGLYDIEWSVYGKDLGGGNSEIIASSPDDTIAFTGTSNIWYSFNMSMYGWDYYFPYNDTIIYKVTFKTDSIQTSKEGWMLDNISTTEWISSTSENLSDRISILAYPNPFRGIITFKSTYTNKKINTIKIFNIYGSLINCFNTNSMEISINLSNLQTGVYIFQATDNSEETYVGKLLKE